MLPFQEGMSAPAVPVARVLRFDPFELNLHAGELRKRGVKLRLQGQPIQVLALLLESAGHLVTREEIRSRLWSADTFVDFDHSLHNAIARIREVLGDSAEAPRYIETLPRRGYRFIAPVEEVQAAPVISPNGRKNGHGAARDESRPVELRPTLIPRTGLMVAAVFFCAVALAAVAAWQHAHATAASPAIRSIAVLPLQNLSGDPTQEYFADGLTEELITEISRIHSLKVLSRTSVMEYKGTRKHLPQIARELGADAIVEGSVVREGDRVRVTVQVLDGRDDRHLWSEEYQRSLHSILNLQRDIAQAIAQHVSARITVAEPPGKSRQARAVNPEAYEAYLRGRYYLYNQYSTPQPLQTARGYFESSIAKDPDLALAHAGLANVDLNLAVFRQLSPQQAFPSMTRATSKALELDDSLSEAHTMLALLHWQYEWDWDAAEQEFRSAIALDPSYECVHAYLATYLAWRGERAEAWSELTKGRELNPGSSYATGESAFNYLLRDYAGLIEASRSGVISDPNEWLERYFLGVGYAGLGRTADAIPEFEKAVAMSGGDQDPSAALAHAYAVIGRRADAEKILADMLRQSQDRYVSPYMLATIYAGLGNKAKAFEMLDKAVGERSPDVVWNLKVDPRLDSLRPDPRFQVVSERVGLAQPQ